MFERTQETCDRYLDRIAQLVVTSSGHERSALLILAARLMRELQETIEQDDLSIQLVERLRGRVVSAQEQPKREVLMSNPDWGSDNVDDKANTLMITFDPRWNSLGFCAELGGQDD